MSTAGEVYIEAKAKEIQKANGSLTYEQAYDRALQENPEFYTMHAQEIAKRDPGEVREELRREAERKKPKPPKLSDEEEELERLARKRADETGETFAKAYDEVIQTDEGRGLYTKLTGL